MSQAQISALLRNAALDLGKGRLDRAADLYEKVLQKDRRNQSALLGIAKIALATDSYHEALKATEEIFKQAPNNVEAVVYWSVAKEGQGKRRSVIARLRKLANSHPKDSLIQFHTGRMLAAENVFGDALNYLKRYAALLPKEYEGQILLGNTYFAHSEFGNAIRAFRNALRLQPERMEAYFFLTDVLTATKELKLAHIILDRALKNFGSHPSVLQKQAGLYVFEGKIKQALEKSLRVCDRLPENGQVWINLGSLHLMSEDIEAAEKAFLKASEVDPHLWDADFQLGMLYEATGLDGKAKTAYLSAMEKGPEEWEPANNYGLILLAGDKPEEHKQAEMIFRKAIDTARLSDYSPGYNLALAQAKMKHWKDCIKTCDVLLGLGLPEEVNMEIKRLRSEAINS